MIYYANSDTGQDADHALTTGWIAASVTPLTNLNSGFCLYEVDTGDLNIYNGFTTYSDISVYSTLQGTSVGPMYQFEYSTRDTYGPDVDRQAEDPLNTTFWHRMTEAMETNITLVSVLNTMGNSSVRSPKLHEHRVSAGQDLLHAERKRGPWVAVQALVSLDFLMGGHMADRGF